MNCETGYFAGLSDVICKLGKINGIMLTDKGTTFTDTTFETEATHHVAIASKTSASRNAMVYPVINYEDTTDDVTIQTSNLNFKDTDGKPLPSMLLHLDVGVGDYQTLKNLEGKLFDVVLFTDQMKQLGTRKTTISTIKGFRAKVAFKYGLPKSDNGQLQYAMYVFFRAQNEFENLVFVNPDYSFADLVDFVPIGLDLRVTTIYNTTSGIVVVKATVRSTGLGKTGLLAADFEILESVCDLAPAVVTSLTDDGLGYYSILIQDSTGTPANLIAGEWYKLQARDEDTTPTYNTYQSNAMKETVK